MKKITYLLGILLVGGLIFSACNKDDDDDEPTDVAPQMNFKGGTHQASGTEYVDGDVTLTVSQIFWVGINANANPNTDEKLTNLKVVRKYQDVITVTQVDTTFDDPEVAINMDMGFQAYPQPGAEVWTFTVTDDAGEQTTLSFTVTTEPGAATIEEYDETVLGSYDSPTNSSFASIDGMTYNMADATANSEKIDWIFFDGNTYSYTLIAPDDNLVESVYPAVGGWTTRNNTRFKVTDLNPSDFADITSATQLSVAAQGADLTRLSDSELANGVNVNDVFAFVTADGKNGLIQITDITEGATNGTSTISFKVKVEI